MAESKVRLIAGHNATTTSYEVDSFMERIRQISGRIEVSRSFVSKPTTSFIITPAGGEISESETFSFKIGELSLTASKKKERG